MISTFEGLSGYTCGNDMLPEGGVVHVKICFRNDLDVPWRQTIRGSGYSVIMLDVTL